METSPSTDPLSATFAALADPTRRAILARLAKGAANVGELAEPFDISLPAVSRHLKVLESADLIVREKDAQRRVCRFNPEALVQAGRWISIHKDLWNQNLDALDDYLSRLKEDGEPE